MAKRLLIDALHPEEMRVAIADERNIFDFDFITSAKQQVKGNIYLAKITRVEPSLQAAFVEYGGGKQGFLPFAEIHADYYQIPVSDRKKLMEEAEGDDDMETEDAPSQPSSPDAGIGATLRDAPAFESGPGYAMGGEENSSLEGAEDYEDVAGPALPTLEAIPEQDFSEEGDSPSPVEAEAAPERAPRTRKKALPENAVAFANSELVAQETVENEQLASQLAPASDEGEGRASKEDEGVETLSEDEDRPKRNNFHRRYKIQEVIKRGQIVLVQVIKEERGNKGCSLTTYLSLAGRYCVLMPNSPKDGGISRKINDGDTRKRLKEVLTELKLARGMSVIIRTAGIDRTRAEIRRDFDYLVKLWNKIRETTLGSTAPALIYEESDLIKRSIRDLYANDIEEVLIEGEAAYKSARDFMKMLLPSHTPRVKHYKESMPLFYAYGIEEQLLSMHDPIVKLRSGGYIVINPTEALISIDVNSGRSTGERNIEETATKTNLEAANEIARQLRLRDNAGLIVIDFIDMFESRNRRNVERALKDALKSDRAKIQLGRISPFGLLEMSRQRLRPSIAEASTVQCTHCLGRGHVRSNESLSIQIVRSLEKEASSGNWQAFKLSVPEHIALYLLNSKRGLFSQIEERYGVQISVVIDHELSGSVFTLEKIRRGGRAEGEAAPRERAERGERSERASRGRGRGRDREREAPLTPVRNEDAAPDDIEDTESETVEAGSEESAEAKGERSRRRRGRRGGRGRDRERGERPDRAVQPEGAEGVAVAGEGAEGEPATGEPRPPRERGERGGRGRGGRRRWRDEDGAAPRAEGEAQPQADARPAREPRPPREPREPRGDRPQREPRAPREHSAAPVPTEALPGFTRSPVVEQMPKRQEFAPTHSPVKAEPQAASTTARPEGAPPRKGWWQRIIELD